MAEISELPLSKIGWKRLFTNDILCVENKQETHRGTLFTESPVEHLAVIIASTETSPKGNRAFNELKMCSTIHIFRSLIKKSIQVNFKDKAN